LLGVDLIIPASCNRSNSWCAATIQQKYCDHFGINPKEDISFVTYPVSESMQLLADDPEEFRLDLLSLMNE
jgi:hypothetical protein